MSMIDYGTLVRVNGKIVNKNEMFMDMKKAVGFEIDELEDKEWYSNCYIKDNFFAYFGDKEFLCCVYKTQIVFISNNKIIKHFSNSDMINKYTYHDIINGIKITIKSLEKESKYYTRFWYKDNLYECIFGYGIDNNKATYNRIKNEYYNKKTICIIDEWWKNE